MKPLCVAQSAPCTRGEQPDIPAALPGPCHELSGICTGFAGMNPAAPGQRGREAARDGQPRGQMESLKEVRGADSTTGRDKEAGEVAGPVAGDGAG